MRGNVIYRMLGGFCDRLCHGDGGRFRRRSGWRLCDWYRCRRGSRFRCGRDGWLRCRCGSWLCCRYSSRFRHRWGRRFRGRCCAGICRSFRCRFCRRGCCFRGGRGSGRNHWGFSSRCCGRWRKNDGGGLMAAHQRGDQTQQQRQKADRGFQVILLCPTGRSGIRRASAECRGYRSCPKSVLPCSCRSLWELSKPLVSR